MRRNVLLTTLGVLVVAVTAFSDAAAATTVPTTASVGDGITHTIASAGGDIKFLDGLFDKFETVLIDYIAVRGGPLAFAAGLVMHTLGKSGNIVEKGGTLMWGGVAISIVGVGWKTFNQLLQWLGTF